MTYVPTTSEPKIKLTTLGALPENSFAQCFYPTLPTVDKLVSLRDFEGSRSSYVAVLILKHKPDIGKTYGLRLSTNGMDTYFTEFNDSQTAVAVECVNRNDIVFQFKTILA